MKNYQVKALTLPRFLDIYCVTCRNSMCCSSQSYPGRTLAKLLVCGLLLHGAMTSFQASSADASSQLPLIPEPVQWLSGPIDTSLAGGAEIHVPAGYRFTDAKGARVLLESARAAVPDGLTGLIAPVAGDWWISLAYKEPGHISISDRNHFDQDALLKAYWIETGADRKGRGLPALSHINWVRPPAYHPSRDTMDCAIRLEGFTPQDQKIAFIAYVLGRRGVVEAKGMRAWRDGDDGGAFVDAVKGIAFKTGQRYADFQSGEKAASGTLADLIAHTGKQDVQTASLSGTSGPYSAGMKLFWIGFAAIGCVGISGVVLIAKALRRTKPVQTHVSEPAPAPTRPVLRPNVALAPKPFSNGIPKPAVKKVNGNGHRPPDRNGLNGKKRRMFNYHKFYTEMMLQGPAPVIGEPVNGQNGHDFEAVRDGTARNGHQNGESSSVVLNAHSEIIASQKALIEEQKRLIVEQARLIEEKSKLISEKNQLLDRQSQMIDNNLL